MKLSVTFHRPHLVVFLVPLVLVVGFLGMAHVASAQDGSDARSNDGSKNGLSRLIRKANIEPTPSAENASLDVKSVNPDSIPADHHATHAALLQEFKVAEPSGFSARDASIVAPAETSSPSFFLGDGCYDPERRYNPWNPQAGPDEYVFDGDDQGKPVRADQDWKVYGLDIEDTVGHFDTLDGRRLVAPSNRVAIYAPRFGSVRRIDGLVNAESRLSVNAFEEKTMIARSEARDFSTTTKQHLAPDGFDGNRRASGLINRTRGVPHETVTHLFGVRNQFEAFENLSLIKFGKFSNAESARLGLGMQSANHWQDNLGLQVDVANVKPLVVNDVYRVQQLITIESDDKAAILRVVKIASKLAARPGEEVDFTIRFDNLTGRQIGNVTIIDNLTGRLEYVPNSAECSLNAEFVNEENETGSLMLRWEITDPLPANSGGLIRFKCRVR